MIHVFLSLAHLLNEEVVDRLVRERVRVFEVQAVASFRNDHSGNVRAGESLLCLSRDAATARGAIVAATTAERHVALAGNDNDWTSEGVWSS